MIKAVLSRVAGWYTSLPRGWLVVFSSVVLLVAVGGSVGMYQMYDYVQHDNDFCTTCHLMQEPFNKFDASSHRGLGCKACHRPTMVQRTSMALAQVLERPDSITHHAEVPTETCAECHINGDPEEWKLVANSAGHRIHLESKDPKLSKIECLSCHGSGIHEFAVAEKTCGQAECHEQTKVKLGKMSNLTLHCASCHDFNKPVARSVVADSLDGTLTPARNDCFSCHAMRENVARTIPKDEPHKAVCGTCHNPHDQATPGEAVKTCASGGCHQKIDTVTAMHRELSMGALQNCTSCHAAHTWKARADDCGSCHKPEELDQPVKEPIKRVHVSARQQSVFDLVLAPTRLLIAAVANPPFRHKLHTKVACKTCHESDTGHGVLKITTAADCAGCHHSTENRARCASCHTSNELGGTFRRNVLWKLSVWKEPRTRALDFTHTKHAKTECQSCHALSADMRSPATCNSCHKEHHEAARSCTACHADGKTVKEHDRKAHLSCASSGCHSSTVTAPLRTQRNVCLACHSEHVDHEPQGDCASCHMIPKKPKEARR
jgi:nitrate/TMAO reductase-like tetraheme cytochrome c subunit